MEAATDTPASGISGTEPAEDAAEGAAPPAASVDVQAVARLAARLDELKVPTERDGAPLAIDARVELLVEHFNRQYLGLDRGIASLANAIDTAYALIGGTVVTYAKTAKAAAILRVAGQAITRREP